jgi:3-oxoacyl-[acyl-carrier-protein] synthase-3
MNNGAFIVAIEYAFPNRKVSTSELAEKHPEWQMDQVMLRAGVETRYWCQADETALDLAETACRRLIDRTGNDLKQIDAILFCTQSPDYIMPPNACILQHRLSLPRNIAALDYNLACSGYIYGLFLAKALIVSGSARNVLLVTAETYSKWMHPDDRGPMTLFGDAAAATLISTSDQIGLGDFALATGGGSAKSFFIPAGGARLPCSPETKRTIEDKNGNIRTLENLFMDGAAILDFVKQEIPPLVKNLLNQANLTLDDLDLVIFHQASQVTLDFLHRALHIPPHKQFSNLLHVGNTVSASIPIALRDAELQGALKPGMKVMVVGFGVGLSWGGCIITWS